MGLMGRGYYRIVCENPHTCVTAVCDIDPQRCRPEWYAAASTGSASGTDDDSVLQLGGRDHTGEEAAAEPFGDFRPLESSPDVDVVAVTAPTALHADMTVAALESGKHVICEKPMGLTLADCERMLAAAEKAGRMLIIGQCVRFFPQYELVKRYVDEGTIGRPRYAVLTRLASPPNHSKDDWMLNSRISNGALFDLHVHDVDFVQHVFGPPETLYARGSTGPSGGIDHVVATYGYADGLYVEIEGGWSLHAPWPFDMAITVHGDKGSLYWAASRGPNVLHYDGDSEPRVLECPNEGGTRRLLDYFVDCVCAGRPVARCTPQSARLSVGLVVLEDHSIKSRAAIDVGSGLKELGVVA
jgi:predicted dehydrogenase